MAWGLTRKDQVMLVGTADVEERDRRGELLQLFFPEARQRKTLAISPVGCVNVMAYTGKQKKSTGKKEYIHVSKVELQVQIHLGTILQAEAMNSPFHISTVL